MTLDDVWDIVLHMDDRTRTELLGRLQAHSASEHRQAERPAWLDAASAYALHREKQTGDPWQAYGANQRHFDDVVTALRPIAAKRQVTLAAVCRESAEGFFSDAKMASRKWPVGFWAKDPAAWLKGSGSVMDAETERMRALDRQLDDAVQRGDHAKADILRATIQRLARERRKKAMGT